MPQPDRELILKRYRKGQERLSRFYQEFDEAEAFYEGDWEPGGPEGFPQTVPATASSIVDEATDHIDTDNITPHVPTIGKTQQSEQSAGKLKDFIIGAWSYFSAHSEDIPPLRDFTKNLFLGGKAVLEILPDFDCWPEPEIVEGMTNEKKDELMEEARAIRSLDFPIVCSSISPRWVIEDPTIGRKTWLIKHYLKDVEEVRALYPDWPDPRRAEQLAAGQTSLYDSDNVEIIDYWQEGSKDEKKGQKTYGCWHVTLADGEEAQSGFNEDYPLPYVIKFSGFGRESRDGQHHKKARGILHGIKSLLMAYGRRLTQLDVITAFYATPAMFSDADEEFEFKWEPGWMNRVPKGTTIQTPSLPTPHPALIATIAELRSDIEEGTFGSVLGGQKQPGTRSAAEHAILSAQAELRFRSVKRAVSDAIRQVDEKMITLVRDVLLLDVNDEIIVPTADDTMEKPPSLRKSDIPSPFYHSVELKDMSPSAISREALVAVQLYTGGVIDLEEAMERAGITGTADMKKRVMRDKVMQTPYVINHLGRDLVEAYTGEPVEEMEFQELLLQMHQQMKLAAAQGQAQPQGQGMNQAAAPMGLGAMQGQTGMMPGGPEQMAQTIQTVRKSARPKSTPA